MTVLSCSDIRCQMVKMVGSIKVKTQDVKQGGTPVLVLDSNLKMS